MLESAHLRPVHGGSIKVQNVAIESAVLHSQGGSLLFGGENRGGDRVSRLVLRSVTVRLRHLSRG